MSDLDTLHRLRDGQYGASRSHQELRGIADEVGERCCEECMVHRSEHVEINKAGAAFREYESVRERDLAGAKSALDDQRARALA